MKITSIKHQVKQSSRYSIFLDGKYAFSLSDRALLDSKLITGQELKTDQIREFKQLSENDKLYSQTLNFIALRLRTKWEVETYLKRKKASPALSNNIVNKLSVIGLIDDKKFATAFVNDRYLLRPTSSRKMTMELRKKHIEEGIIREVLAKIDQTEERTALQTIIERKRHQTRYKDNLKLMQYLARQGFNYADIKSALENIN